MTHVLTQSTSFDLNGASKSVFAGLTRALADWRLYRRTVAELGALNRRELADLGLSRADIQRTARASVYGA